MSSQLIVRISITGLVAIAVSLFLLTSFNAATPSSPKTCSESTDDCCKKHEAAGTGSEIDFETLSGKFFSSASY